MKREQLLDLATGVVIVCTLAVGGLALWDRLTGTGVVASSSREDREVSDWEVVAGGGHRIGPVDAPVVVVEFGDYECPFCRAIAPHVKALQQTFPNDVAVVYRHLPLPMHANAYFAARLADCAADQGRFEAAHDLLNSVLTFVGLDVEEFAQRAGISDTAEFTNCARSSDDVPRIEEDLALAESIGATWTPSFVIDGVLQGSTPDSLQLFELVRERLQNVQSR